MAKVGKFIHVSSHDVNIAASATYAVARSQAIPLYTNPLSFSNPNPRANALLSGLFVQVDTIAGGATQLIVKITTDAAGDNAIIGDVTCGITTGVTTPTVGTISVQILVDWVSTSDDLYLFWRTNAGTCTVKKINLTWEE